MKSGLNSRQILLVVTIAGGLTITFLPPLLSAGDFKYDTEPRSSADRVWPSNQVRALQLRLQEMDFEPGPADGIYGPITAQAIKSYQRSRDLLVDGLISDQLMDKLELY
jgi:peptidoglycan hydrolase-like protein with peptidoglycan-binding domain